MNIGGDPGTLYIAPTKSFREQTPLTRRFYLNPDNKPLKTGLAKKFPLLSRRERRALLWAAQKASQRA